MAADRARRPHRRPARGTRARASRVAGELASEATVPGSMQVAGDGLPTILLADRPVTGGYPVIAIVAPAFARRGGAAAARPGGPLPPRLRCLRPRVWRASATLGRAVEATLHMFDAECGSIFQTDRPRRIDDAPRRRTPPRPSPPSAAGGSSPSRSPVPRHPPSPYRRHARAGAAFAADAGTDAAGGSRRGSASCAPCGSRRS